MTPPDINIKRYAESQREVQMNVSLNLKKKKRKMTRTFKSLKRSCHFSFLFFFI